MKILDFYADWCNPCKVTSKAIDKLKEEYPDLDIEKVNVEEDVDKTSEYSVKNLPTVVLVKDDNTRKTKVGSMTYEQLKEFLEI